MNIAFCIFNYFPYGGLARDMLEVARAAIARGHRVTLYTMHMNGLLPEGMKCVLVPQKGWSHHARAKAFARFMEKAIKRDHIEGVIGFNRMPHLDVYFAGDPCFAEAVRQKHGAWVWWLPRYRVYRALEKAVFHPGATTETVLLDPKEEAIFQRHYQTPAERFHTIFPGLESCWAALPSEEERLIAKEQAKVPKGVFWCVFVGSDFKRKGLDRVLRAIAHLPKSLREKVYCTVIGKDDAHSYQQQCQSLGIADCVDFYGPCEEVRALLPGADLLIHPAYQETAGKVILEAMVSGVPVVCTEECGNSRFVKAANAGEVTSLPFQQEGLDTALARVLVQLDVYKQNALHYPDRQQFFTYGDDIVALLEKTVEKRS